MPYIKKTPEFEMIEKLAEKIPAPLKWLLPDPYEISSYLAPVNIGGVIGKVPRSIFAKKYAKKIALKDREIWQFPGRYSKDPAAGRAVEIPKAIRMGSGIAPKEEVMNEIKRAYNVSKSELGYTHVQDIVDLSGVDRDVIHNALTHLVKSGKAILSVDRWGNAVFIKLK